MPYISHNIGHLMMDEFLPWFTLMRTFNLLSSDAQPLAAWVDYTPGSGHQMNPNPAVTKIEQFTYREQCYGYEKYMEEERDNEPAEECQKWSHDFSTAITQPEFLKLEQGGQDTEMNRLRRAVPITCTQYEWDKNQEGYEFLMRYVYRKKVTLTRPLSQFHHNFQIWCI